MRTSSSLIGSVVSRLLPLVVIALASCGDDPPKTGGFVDAGDAGGGGNGQGNNGQGSNGQGNNGQGSNGQGSNGQGSGGRGNGGQGGSSTAGGAAGSASSASGAAGAGASAAGAAGSGGSGASGGASAGSAGQAAGGIGGTSAGGFGSGGAEFGGGGGEAGMAGKTLGFGGTSGSAGAASGGSAGQAPTAQPCSATPSYGAGVVESVSSPTETDVLAAITPDERTILWFTGSGPQAILHFADRTEPTSAWSVPSIVVGGPYAVDRVLIERTGLVLGVLRADRKSFAGFQRTERGLPFLVNDGATFANLSATLPEGGTLADPVMGEGDYTAFLSVLSPGSTATLFSANRFNLTAVWPTLATASQVELSPQGDKRRRPTGLSADGRSLFYYDEPTSKQRLAQRPQGALSAFATFVDIGDQENAAPVLSCKRIYYSKGGDLFHATAP